MSLGPNFAQDYLNVQKILQTDEGKQLIDAVGYDAACAAVSKEYYKNYATGSLIVYGTMIVIAVTAGVGMGVFAPSALAAVGAGGASSAGAVGGVVSGGAVGGVSTYTALKAAAVGVSIASVVATNLWRVSQSDKSTENELVRLGRMSDAELRQMGYSTLEIQGLRQWYQEFTGVSSTGSFGDGGSAYSSFLSIIDSLVARGVAPNEAMKMASQQTGVMPSQDQAIAIYNGILASLEKQRRFEEQEEAWLQYTRSITEIKNNWALEDRAFDLALQEFQLLKNSWAVEDREYELDRMVAWYEDRQFDKLKQGAWIEDREYELEKRELDDAWTNYSRGVTQLKDSWAVEDRAYTLQMQGFQVGSEEYKLHLRFFEYYDMLRARGMQPYEAVERAIESSGFTPDDRIIEYLLADAQNYLDDFVGAYRSSDIYDMIQNAINKSELDDIQIVEADYDKAVYGTGETPLHQSNGLVTQYGAGRPYSAQKQLGNETNMNGRRSYGRRRFTYREKQSYYAGLRAGRRRRY